MILLLLKQLLLFLGLLNLQQFILQLIVWPVRILQQNTRHPLLVLSARLTGYSKKSDELAASPLAYVLPFLSLCLLICSNFSIGGFRLPTVYELTAILLVLLAIKLSQLYCILHIYTKAFGVGWNLYFKGDRIFGLDFHNFPVRVDRGGTKSLTTIFRPHIDIPPLYVKYWPWDIGVIRLTYEEMDQVRKSNKQKREQKEQAKVLSPEKLKRQQQIQMIEEKEVPLEIRQFCSSRFVGPVLSQHTENVKQILDDQAPEKVKKKALDYIVGKVAVELKAYIQQHMQQSENDNEIMSHLAELHILQLRKITVTAIHCQG